MDHIEALRLFVRVVERGTFSAAARDQKIKQSTASKWIAELEEELGASLIQRTTRSVHVTDAGRKLLARAGDVLAAFDALHADFAEQSPVPAGRVRMSLPATFGRLFVVPAVADFLLRFPDVHAELSMNDRYVSLVEEGFDLAVRIGVPSDTTARGRKLAEVRRVLVASPRYVRAHGQPTTPKDLRDHECLVHGDGDASMMWRFARHGGTQVPSSVRGRIVANSAEALLIMARSGLGVALLADWLVGEDLRRGRLVPLLEDYTTPPAPIYALVPPARYLSPAVRALLDHLAVSLAARLGACASEHNEKRKRASKSRA